MATGWRGQYSRYTGFFLNIVDLYKKRSDLRAFLEVILSLTTIVIFTTFALKPTILTIISLTREIKEKENVLSLLEQKNIDLQIASDLLIQNQNKIEAIDSAIPTSPNPDKIAVQIQGLAFKNSVSLLGLSIGQATLIGKNPSVEQRSDFKPIQNAGGEMTISVSVKGSYYSINSFAKDLENLRIVVKVDLTTINASTTETGQAIVAVISGRVPYTKDE